MDVALEGVLRRTFFAWLQPVAAALLGVCVCARQFAVAVTAGSPSRCLKFASTQQHSSTAFHP